MKKNLSIRLKCFVLAQLDGTMYLKTVRHLKELLPGEEGEGGDTVP